METDRDKKVSDAHNAVWSLVPPPPPGENENDTKQSAKVEYCKSLLAHFLGEIELFR